MKNKRQIFGSENAKNDDTIHICDYCMLEMKQGEFETLRDGLERCEKCSSTALHDDLEIQELFHNTIKKMENVFDIQLPQSIQVIATDAQTIAEESYEDLDGPETVIVVADPFTPTPGFDGRTVAFVKPDDKNQNFKVFVEYGTPKHMLEGNIVNVLTEIWQIVNWNMDKLSDLYSECNLGIVYDGMSAWAEIQYMLCLYETDYAKRLMSYYVDFLESDDQAKLGLSNYMEQYTFEIGISHPANTPFKTDPPLKTPLTHTMDITSEEE